MMLNGNVDGSIASASPVLDNNTFIIQENQVIGANRGGRVYRENAF